MTTPEPTTTNLALTTTPGLCCSALLFSAAATANCGLVDFFLLGQGKPGRKTKKGKEKDEEGSTEGEEKEARVAPPINQRKKKKKT
jgi:hypothetical protein